MPLKRLLLDVSPLWNSPDSFQSALSLLPTSVHARITRYHFLTDRKLSLGSALLQRLIICRHYTTHSSLSSVNLHISDTNGRPSFPGAAIEQVRVGMEMVRDYNVSHHNPREAVEGEKALVALVVRTGREGRVGVDVVPTRCRGDGEEFLKTFSEESNVFTGRELGRIRAELTVKKRVRCLLIHWALKEAYVKAVGTGIVTDLLAVEFRGIGDVVMEGLWGTNGEIEVWVDGVERTGEWGVEVTYIPGREKEGEGFYVAVLADREGLGNMGGRWEELDYEEDIRKPWGGG